MQDAFVGTWKLSPEKSRFDANHRPAAATMVFELDSQGRYLMKAEGIKENGQRVVERPTTIVPNGSEQPVADFPGLTAIATRPDANTVAGSNNLRLRFATAAIRAAHRL